MNEIDYEAQVKRLANALHDMRVKERETRKVLLSASLAFQLHLSGGIDLTTEKIAELRDQMRGIL